MKKKTYFSEIVVGIILLWGIAIITWVFLMAHQEKDVSGIVPLAMGINGGTVVAFVGFCIYQWKKRDSDNKYENGNGHEKNQDS
jgi:hypothetical protein